MKHTNRPDPKTGLDGKFSVQYVLARALAEGIVSLDVFSDTSVCEPATRAVMTKVRSAADPQARMDTDRALLRDRQGDDDGGRCSRSLRRPPARPRPRSSVASGHLEAKFVDCARQVVEPRVADELLSRLLALDAEDRIATLSQLMATGSPRALPRQVA